MTRRCLLSIYCLAVAVAIGWLAPASAVGQAVSTASRTSAAKNSPPARTPDGQPDLQGIWSFATITPLERPAELAGKESFTEKEAAGLRLCRAKLLEV
jgi:hypothetical protein